MSNKIELLNFSLLVVQTMAVNGTGGEGKKHSRMEGIRNVSFSVAVQSIRCIFLEWSRLFDSLRLCMLKACRDSL